jgi:hypothetical protein
MVNFHDEFSQGRFYKQSTFNRFKSPKQNPFTRAPIISEETTRYKAKLANP